MTGCAEGPADDCSVEACAACVLCTRPSLLQMLLLVTIAADSLSSDMTGALSAGLLLKWAQPPLCVLYRGRQCLPGALQVRCLAIQVPTCVLLRALCTPV